MRVIYLSLALLLFGFISTANSKECVKEFEALEKDQIEALILELNEIELDRSSSVIRRVGKNKFFVKSNVQGEVCVVPMHLKKHDSDLIGRPHCFMSSGDAEKVYEISFELEDRVLDVDKPILFSAPFKGIITPREARIFAESFEKSYGNKSYLKAYEKTIAAATKNPLKENEINGAYILEDKAYYFPPPFSQYIKAPDALLFGGEFDTLYDDGSYLRSFHYVLDRKKHLTKF